MHRSTVCAPFQVSTHEAVPEKADEQKSPTPQPAESPSQMETKIISSGHEHKEAPKAKRQKLSN